MKKRIFTLALALILCLSLVPTTALAAGELSVTGGGITISVAKLNYEQQEPILVTVSGVTAQMEDDRAYVGLFDPAEESKYRSVDSRNVDVGTGEYSLDRFNVESGTFEIRFYPSLYGDESPIILPGITVGKVAVTGGMTIDKTAYKAGEVITVNVTGATEEMVQADAYVGVFHKGAKHENGEAVGITVQPSAGDGTYTSIKAPNENGEFEMRYYADGWNVSADTLVASVPFTVSGAVQADGWAVPELQQADELGLIPDSLKDADLTQPITRAEFAAVAVKMYEKMSGTKAAAPAKNPFTDTSDSEVLKAANIGIVDGYGNGIFRPNELLSREQAATMLTRVYKKLTMPGWSIVTDESFPLSFTMPAKFIDDACISGYAYESVYYMAANSILQGDNGLFLPNNTVPGYEAFGGAQRQHAIIISLRVVENLDV